VAIGVVCGLCRLVLLLTMGWRARKAVGVEYGIWGALGTEALRAVRRRYFGEPLTG